MIFWSSPASHKERPPETPAAQVWEECPRRRRTPRQVYSDGDENLVHIFSRDKKSNLCGRYVTSDHWKASAQFQLPRPAGLIAEVPPVLSAPELSQRRLNTALNVPPPLRRRPAYYIVARNFWRQRCSFFKLWAPPKRHNVRRGRVVSHIRAIVAVGREQNSVVEINAPFFNSRGSVMKKFASGSAVIVLASLVAAD